jgi:hypothetical protein
VRCPRISVCYLCGDAEMIADELGASVKSFSGFCDTVVATVGDTWDSDELYLSARLSYSPRWLGVRELIAPRICRTNWTYDRALLSARGYADAHLPRPYHKHRKAIDLMLGTLNQTAADESL